MKFFYVILFLGFLHSAAFAVQPNEMLANPQLEARARQISEDLRCLVCQNQSIDDSDADLAHDLRILVRQRLQAGDSDAAVKQFLVDRYGDYILLNPPLKASTFALWAGPLLFLFVALSFSFMFLRRGKGEDEAEEPVLPLSLSERKKIAELLDAKHEDKDAP